jgi:hypothetical protein
MMKNERLPKPPRYVRLTIVICASIGILILTFNLVAVVVGTLTYGYDFLDSYLSMASNGKNSVFGNVVNLSNFKATFWYVLTLTGALGLMGYEIKDLRAIWNSK